jgi:hypothetical protein
MFPSKEGIDHFFTEALHDQVEGKNSIAIVSGARKQQK